LCPLLLSGVALHCYLILAPLYLIYILEPPKLFPQSVAVFGIWRSTVCHISLSTHRKSLNKLK
ncbi:hypothetical protein B0H16DRAFT_1683250, partial [Mycena metata]